MPRNVVVFAETTCERCGAINRRDKIHWDTLPEGWSSLLVVIYGKPEEDYHSYQRVEKTLCRNCLFELESFLEKP